jgi:hypothetical protein
MIVITLKRAESNCQALFIDTLLEGMVYIFIKKKKPEHFKPKLFYSRYFWLQENCIKLGPLLVIISEHFDKHCGF